MTTATKRALQGFTASHVFDNSSVLDEAHYDADTKRLFLSLISGSTPAYENVSEAQWLNLISSPSAGKYWNNAIRYKAKGINGDVDLYDRNTHTPDAGNAAINVWNTFEAPKTSTTTSTVFFVTVAVEAPSLAVAVNDLTSEGYTVTAVTSA